MNPTASKVDAFDLVGTTLEEGKLLIQGVAGEGGFSVVYKAWHYGLETPVAVKCLHLPPSLVGEEYDGFLAKLKREGQLLHKLHRICPHIVQMIGTGSFTWRERSVPYIVLDWLDGADLDAWLAERRAAGLPPLSLEETITLLDSAAEALARAHANGVAHRDVKPSNLWVMKSDEGDYLKLLDFGIAKEFDANVPAAHKKTDVNARRPFTPEYAAPEQYNPKLGATGPATDVFALALVAVELLTGTCALGDDRALCALEACRTDLRPTPRAKGSSISDSADAVFLRALAVNPEHRYANVSEFWSALCLAAGLPTRRWSRPPRDANLTPPQPALVVDSPPPVPRPQPLPPATVVPPLAWVPPVTLERSPERSNVWNASSGPVVPPAPPRKPRKKNQASLYAMLAALLLGGALTYRLSRKAPPSQPDRPPPPPSATAAGTGPAATGSAGLVPSANRSGTPSSSGHGAAPSLSHRAVSAARCDPKLNPEQCGSQNNAFQLNPE